MNLRLNALQLSEAPIERVRPAITTRTRLLYGAGSLAFGIKDYGCNVLLLLYYNQVMGLPADLVGTIAMTALILDAIIDPVIGQISDRWRSKWGRRHPFMYLSAIPAALTYLLLWNAPAQWGHTALAIYLLVTIIVVRSCIALNEIPSSALVAELSHDYDARTTLASYRTFFAWIGGIAMGFVAFVAFLRPDADHPVGQLNPVGYSHYGIAASVVILIAILVSAAGTHHQIPWLRQDDRPRGGLRSVIGDLFSTVSNRPFLILLLAAMCSALAGGLQITLSSYFNTYFWMLGPNELSILLASALLAAACGAILTPVISRRFGKKRSAIVLTLLSIVANYAPFVLRLLDLFPENGTSPLLALLFIDTLVSLALTAGSAILIASMLADVSEDSELSTGQRSEGIFFSANSFVLKCVSGIGLFASGLILSAVHFPTGAVPATVDPQIVRQLALLALPVQGVFYLISAALLFAYPISRSTHEATLARLAARSHPEAVSPRLTTGS